MSLPKGDIINSKQFILSGKYEIVDTLGNGSTGSVYLARHQSLSSLCAIKAVPKQSAHSNIILSEAQLLKSLCHTGIPKVYDLEQDDEFFYLVEEYLCGIRLDEFLLQHINISLYSFFNIFLQLCDIFCYLHSHPPSPVIYQDLKPEHVLLCGEEVKLIDYSVSTLQKDIEKQQSFFGNLLFAAPEVIAGHSPSIASDIYSLGKLLEYMLAYVSKDFPRQLQDIINKSIDVQPSCRFETVASLKEAIEKYKNNLGKTRLSQHIAVVGCHSGCGTTHFSFALTSALNSCGFRAVYQERNLSNALRQAMDYLKSSEKEGLYYYHYFVGVPLYGPGISFPTFDFSYQILDLGHNFSAQDLETADLILFVCDNAFWHRGTAEEKFKILLAFKDKLKIIGNRCNHSTALFYAKEFHLPIHVISDDKDPFALDSRKCNILLQILQLKGRRKLFFPRKKIPPRII